MVVVVAGGGEGEGGGRFKGEWKRAVVVAQRNAQAVNECEGVSSRWSSRVMCCCLPSCLSLFLSLSRTYQNQDSARVATCSCTSAAAWPPVMVATDDTSDGLSGHEKGGRARGRVRTCQTGGEGQRCVWGQRQGRAPGQGGAPGRWQRIYSLGFQTHARTGHEQRTKHEYTIHRKLREIRCGM